MRIDLNADVGESFGAHLIGSDAALMRSITSANIAAGFHGGDPTVLRDTVRLAKAHGVAIGAHPGLPDLQGFGRREMRIAPREAEDLVLYQIAAVAGVASAEGVRIRHVKPHGALYNMAARNADLASAIVRAVAALDRSLILYAPPASELLRAARAAGLRAAAEGFADRAYEPDGSLRSRQMPDAVLHEGDVVVPRALALVRDRTVVAINGATLTFDVDTLCVHGDTPGAGELAARLRSGLEASGVDVRAPEP
jgi:UPF0271 protein